MISNIKKSVLVMGLAIQLLPFGFARAGIADEFRAQQDVVQQRLLDEARKDMIEENAKSLAALEPEMQQVITKIPYCGEQAKWRVEMCASLIKKFGGGDSASIVDIGFVNDGNHCGYLVKKQSGEIAHSAIDPQNCRR
jgi:predicted RNA-binding Zn-ribbon protein involved in translation (DUF1610 family)